MASLPSQGKKEVWSLKFTRFGCENPPPEALGFLDAESCVGLTIFFQRCVDSSAGINQMTLLPTFVEIREMDQREFFLRLRPHEWCMLAGSFLPGRRG
jgi:hypothetical protein